MNSRINSNGDNKVILIINIDNGDDILHKQQRTILQKEVFENKTVNASLLSKRAAGLDFPIPSSTFVYQRN